MIAASLSARNARQDDALPLVQALPLSALRPSPRNPRRHFDPDALQALADSIQQHGVLEPILVRPLAEPDAYEVVGGERRFRAAQINGMDAVPCRILAGLDDEAALRLTLVENLQRQDLDPIEEAEGYAKLRELGIKQAAIAEAVNRAQPTVANRMRLLKLPADVQDRIRRGELSPAHGIALARFEQWPAAISVMAEHAVKRGWTSKQLEGNVPFGSELAEAKLVEAIRFASGFDTTVCQHCPFAANIGGYCFKPAHAADLRAAAEAARVAQARAAGDATAAPLPRAADLGLRMGGIVYLTGRPRPAGCDTTCPCEQRARDFDGKVIAVCTNVERYKQFETTEREAWLAAGQRALDAELARLHAHLDQLTAIDARALALLVAQALMRNWPTTDVGAALARYAPTASVPADLSPFTAQASYPQLAALEPLPLLRFALAVLLGSELASHYRYHYGAPHRTTPMSHWYAGLGVAPEGAPAGEED